MSDQVDEFEKYDFSEFTAQDLQAIDAHLARAYYPALQIVMQQDSPYNKFLSWKKYLGVTDIVSPVWCEVQYEYSLYGKRNKPIHLRPSSFYSKSGKQIRVRQQVADANDRRLKRGKSVHKALEEELRPTKAIVRVTSPEERFGLRFVQLMDGFTQLMSNGITRELPVFIITHGQVVFGVIDEVRCVPSKAAQDQTTSLGPPSSSCGSPPHKKQRLTSSSLAQQSASDPTNDPSRIASTGISGGPFDLRIIDYKTRRSATIPVEEDCLSPRLQLMMYHRMLSSLLNPEAFDFNLLWTRLNLDPTKPFSAQFVQDIAWKDRQIVHLNCLASEWISTVQRKRSEILGVSRQLQLVYRRPTFEGKQQGKSAAESADIEDPLEALLLKEELDLAHAIEQSLSQLGHEEGGRVAHNVAQNIIQAGPASIGRTSAIWKDLVSPSSDQDDLAMAWAIQHSLLECAHKASTETPAKQTERGLDAPQPVEAPSEDQAATSSVIGTREFDMDDAELDTRVTDVLQWWFGLRPPKGVDVGQTNRCFTCEFQDSCEWREKKAKEATALAAERRAQQNSADTSNSIWPTSTA